MILRKSKYSNLKISSLNEILKLKNAQFDLFELIDSFVWKCNF